MEDPYYKTSKVLPSLNSIGQPAGRASCVMHLDDYGGELNLKCKRAKTMTEYVRFPDIEETRSWSDSESQSGHL